MSVRGLKMAVYSLGSGFAAVVAGAAASLLVHGTTAKIVVWAGVAAAVAIVAGCVYPVR